MLALQDLRRQQRHQQQQQRRRRIILHFRRADPMRVHYEEIDRKIAHVRQQAERVRGVRRLKLTFHRRRENV